MAAQPTLRWLRAIIGALGAGALIFFSLGLAFGPGGEELIILAAIGAAAMVFAMLMPIEQGH